MKSNMNTIFEPLSENQMTHISNVTNSLKCYLAVLIKNFWKNYNISYKNLCNYLGYSKKKVGLMIEGVYPYSINDITNILYKTKITDDLIIKIDKTEFKL